MAYSFLRRRGAGITGFILVLLIMLGSFYCYGDSEHGSSRTDLIFIDQMKVFSDLERPAVMFPHDKHTENGKADCSQCHMKEKDGSLSQKFMRTTDLGKDAMMQLYHEKCMACHVQQGDSGKETGPITCGNCHQRKPEYSSTRKNYGFNHSMHTRHYQALDNKCETCHHESSGNTKLQQQSCRDCHRENATKDTSSMREVSHASCIGCHMKMKKGPNNCAGCHSEAKQNSYKALKDIPRLKHNQPDVVWVSSPSGMKSRSKLPSVPFNHKNHEAYTDTCRVCHHESMKKCSECHEGTDKLKAGGVNLEEAIHMVDSNHSCIGCHNSKKLDKDCAGCHANMDESTLSKTTCLTCHVKNDKVVFEGDVDPNDPSLWLKRDKKLSFKLSDIPEHVTINKIENKYKAAKFPHKKIINALMQKTGANTMATFFHKTEDTLCQGCHHNSPVGELPPSCSNCHGTPFDKNDIHKPGLMGAYHQQCMGCHEQMGLKNLTGCTSCHEKK